MYKILNTTAAFAVLAFAATGDAQALTFNLHKRHRSGYAATVYSQAPRASWPWYVPARSVRDVPVGRWAAPATCPKALARIAGVSTTRCPPSPFFLVVDSGRPVTVFTDKVDLKVGGKSPRTRS
jgi:hypothetical protein